MIKAHLAIATLMSMCVTACSAEDKATNPFARADDVTLMRAEFMPSCQARPEFVSRRHNGTVDQHCECVFDAAMRGLDRGERLMVGFYLYGEQNDAFLTRFRQEHSGSIPDTSDMATAAQAIAIASERCP